MPQVICRQNECLYWEKSLCTADRIVYDPEHGCLTFEPIEGLLLEDEDWDSDEDLFDEDEEEWEDDEDPFEETDQHDWAL
jgi:hypothetical protein